MNNNNKLDTILNNIIDFIFYTARIDVTLDIPKIQENEFLEQINNLNLLQYEFDELKEIINDDKKYEDVLKKIYNIYSKEYDKFKALCNYTNTKEKP
jgi:hypothetical protein